MKKDLGFIKAVEVVKDDVEYTIPVFSEITIKLEDKIINGIVKDIDFKNENLIISNNDTENMMIKFYDILDIKMVK